VKILLDTHIFIWAVTSPQSLSQSATLYLQDVENTFLLSMASVWEMQIKIDLGKLNLNHPLLQVIHERQIGSGIEILPIELPHVYELSNLPHHHRDPFDRLLIAQSRIGEIPILTADAVFSSYDVYVLN
jgi:PIN domain nuclease of toxin-antitoxin system